MLESLETKNSRKVRPLVNNEQIKPVAVIGAGSFGTVISWMLKNAGYPVRLWAFAKEDMPVVRHTIKKYKKATNKKPKNWYVFKKKYKDKDDKKNR